MPMIRHMTLKVVEHAHKEHRNKLKKKYYTEREEELRIKVTKNSLQPD